MKHKDYETQVDISQGGNHSPEPAEQVGFEVGEG